VSGPSVAQGYGINRKKPPNPFQARLAITGEGPLFLRTVRPGPLVHEGELYVTGGLKEPHHHSRPQSLSARHRADGGKKPSGLAARLLRAFSVPVEGEERLVVVQEVGRQAADSNEVIQAIRRRVAEEHELQVYAVVLLEAGGLPKTSSGQGVQRHACRAVFWPIV